MPEAISPELMRKLEIIEAETNFFSQAPAKPKFSKVYAGISIVILAMLLVSAFQEGEFGTLLVVGLAFVLNVMSYLYAKQLFEMYSSACEIIRFYKGGR